MTGKCRAALVTGGNRGIGLAICQGLHEAGLDVVLASRDEAAGRQAASEIGCRSIVLDLEHPNGFADALDAAGPIDILVNNAGVLLRDGMLEAPQDFETSLQVMFKAPFELIRQTVPHMKTVGYGRIVNVSSDWGSFAAGLHGPGGYGVAKAALNALTLALSRELPSCIKINAMCPGWVRTRMGGDAASRSPEQGADTAIWLAQLPKDGPTGGYFRDRKAIEW
ncbi:MAG: SDR family NAD(P)-dependent oxidoreductase [Ahrensia sp.]|nr:SDR family NAD(P)-dependent oxidoreductase [Ahrensia sp.]